MSQSGDTPTDSQFVETPSGLLVPAGAVEPGPGQDPDGRRRIVMTAQDRRALNRAIRILTAAGLGLVVGCKGTCGGVLVNEGKPAKGDRDLDSGYGCKCSRVHFL